MGASYASDDEIKGMGLLGLSDLAPETLTLLGEGASRVFDRAAEVPEAYFAPAPALPAAWAPNTAYTLGARVIANPSNGHQYLVTVAGVTGGAQPAWPTAEGATIVDGTVTWGEDGIPGTTEKVFYGDGTDFLTLPPYVPGTLEEVSLPSDWPTVDFVEQAGGIARAYSSPALSNLLDPAFSWGRRDWTRRPDMGWPLGVAITVSARWGFLETPGDVRQATIQIALKTFRESDPAYVKAAAIEGQIIREDLPPMAKMIAAKWAERGALYGL